MTEAKISSQKSSVEHRSEGIVVRKCSALEEFHACVQLQRDIWGEVDLEIEPVTMFVVASITGGQVLGAFDGGKLVGFTLAVVGVRQGVSALAPDGSERSLPRSRRGPDAQVVSARRGPRARHPFSGMDV
jgi:hypothetical protein